MGGSLARKIGRFPPRGAFSWNAQPGTHADDASHLSEAAETGCSYFITHDGRILRKRDELRGVLPPNLWVVSLEEFFGIFDDFIAGRRM